MGRFLKVFATYLYKTMFPQGMAICDPTDFFKLIEFPCPRDAPCYVLSHLVYHYVKV